MIMFMELSYRDNHYIDRVLDYKKPLTESELYKKNGDRKPRYEYMMMNKELGLYWERKKSYHTSSGLDAVLYETKSDFLYLPNGTAQVLAFRGTNDAKDIGVDITLGTGGNPQQGIDEGDDVVKKTTTYAVNASTGTLPPTVRKDIVNPNGVKSKVVTKIIPVTTRYEADKTRDVGTNTVTNNGSEGKIVTTTPKLVKVGAKDKVVEAPIEPEVEYVKDVEKDFGTPDQRTEGEKGKTVTTTTYDVDPNDGHITEHVGNPVVKIGAKTKVEQSKDSEGRDVIDTTTYEVDSKTGQVTPTTVRTYGTSKEPTVELEQAPKTGDVTVPPKKPDGLTYPSGTKVEMPGEDGKGTVPNSDLPEGKLSGTGKITEPGKPAVGVPNVTIFENGVLADSIKLPELMIEVLWIDEDGNVLKPFVKTGNEKGAEHGLIPGYEFVRTMIDENEPVMIHIFRKVGPNTNTIPVAPVPPATNGGSGQDTPAPTTPNADQVDTQTTIDNGAKSNDSQNVLPNTGTESNATLASLGLLGMLRGLGLALGKKKEY
nr:LPXTG cell wall anchor domain-containing protein [Streptococcus sp. Marseille-Q5986]